MTQTQCLPRTQLLATVTVALSLLTRLLCSKDLYSLASRIPIACLSAGTGRRILPGGEAWQAIA
ncbi:MAG: hypothetical protein K2Y22_02135 [Candidatus Obscuribacterales bacterium]|nr:hypothetical protein [Candidatus Obscuribacterales bacterium]